MWLLPHCDNESGDNKLGIGLEHAHWRVKRDRQFISARGCKKRGIMCRDNWVQTLVFVGDIQSEFTPKQRNLNSNVVLPKGGLSDKLRLFRTIRGFSACWAMRNVVTALENCMPMTFVW